MRPAGAITVTVLLATLAIWTFPLGGVASAQPATGAGSSELWAYGGITTSNVSWHGESGVYVGTVIYGFSATLTQLNTSSTSYRLTENQTVGAVINLTYCHRGCPNPSGADRYYYRAWETWSDVTNFTTTASVTLLNGSSVAALGILSSNVSATANITETLSGARNGSTGILRGLFASASARYALDFAPALGLFPLNLTPNESWVARASFTAAGTWQTAFLSAGPFRQNISREGVGSLAGSGTAAMQGSDRGSLALSEGDLTQVAMNLEVLPTVGSLAFLAGFDLMGGFAILPRAVNLVQPGSDASWGMFALGNTTAQSSFTDLGARSGRAPERFVASAWSYSTAISNPDPSGSGGSNTVQGSPISPAQASSTSECLQGTTSCGTLGTNPTSPVAAEASLLSIAFLSVGTLAVAVIVGGLVISQRRRIPPPTYPNAALYPPGRSAPPATEGSDPAGPELPTDEDDPLRDLW